MSSDNSPNLEMHLFQLPQLLRSWSKSGDLLLRRGGTHFPKGWTCDTKFMTALKASKQEQPQVWVFFLGGLIMEVDETEIGSLQDYSPFTRCGILNLHDEGRKGM